MPHRFIKEFALLANSCVAAGAVFTASCKTGGEMMKLIDYFKTETGAGLVVSKAAWSGYLSFEVQTVNGADQISRINSLLTERWSGSRRRQRDHLCSTRKTPRKLPGICSQQAAG